MLNTPVRPLDIEPSMSGIEARTDRVSERLSVDAQQVDRLPFDLSALESEGLFVNVDAGGFGLLDRRLTWQALGITLPRGSGVAFRPPRSGLLPDRWRLPLLRPPSRAHSALHKYSFRFTICETLFETPAYRWIPWSAFEAFEAEFNAAQSALEAAKADALDNYDTACEEVISAFLQLAGDSVRRLEATGQAIPPDFEDAVVRGVRKAIPSRESLSTKLFLRYRVGVVLLGSEMLAEQRKASEERRRLEAIDAELRLQQRQQQAQEQLVQDELWAEQQRIRGELAAEEEERRREAAIKERLRTLKVEAAKERLQEALSPLDEGARQLHAAVYDSVVAIRQSLNKYGTLRGPAVRRAKQVAAWYRLMDWQSNEQLEGLMAELEQLAKKPARNQQRDRGPINQVLGDIIQLCYADARALAEPHRLNALEI